ncbi:conserved hypothetical protein [Neospora caninum Liverpool]|uniref:Uncharacterized protein n=1 Tax=Neospora caninum (strain Liverpool) TaxID=572307 RepID=F0VQ84_NEOCL|nr:conserved hypothetical protein [Neospora caninum Liverpool]CBZ55881.1 conserved hypothetical protein [Neospora caninum Liverpool]CEL70624.1 TPA: hypothetical protein BN1204_063070 [Neospora caninum Liverpool]|eukprot:XP_003885907.1 conserved hypothetical protein [Neospora caninum Liverpool]
MTRRDYLAALTLLTTRKRLDRRSELFLRLVDRVVHHPSLSRPPYVHLFLHRFAVLGHAPALWKLAATLPSLLPQMVPSHVAISAWSLATCFVVIDSVWDEIGRLALVHLDALSFTDVAMLAWAVARIDRRKPQEILALKSRALTILEATQDVQNPTSTLPGPRSSVSPSAPSEAPSAVAPLVPPHDLCMLFRAMATLLPRDLPWLLRLLYVIAASACGSESPVSPVVSPVVSSAVSASSPLLPGEAPGLGPVSARQEDTSTERPEASKTLAEEARRTHSADASSGENGETNTWVSASRDAAFVSAPRFSLSAQVGCEQSWEESLDLAEKTVFGRTCGAGSLIRIPGSKRWNEGDTLSTVSWSNLGPVPPCVVWPWPGGAFGSAKVGYARDWVSFLSLQALTAVWTAIADVNLLSHFPLAPHAPLQSLATESPNFPPSPRASVHTPALTALSASPSSLASSKVAAHSSTSAVPSFQSLFGEPFKREEGRKVSRFSSRQAAGVRWLLDRLCEETRLLRLDHTVNTNMIAKIAEAMMKQKFVDPRLIYQLIHFVHKRGGEQLQPEQVLTLAKAFTALEITDEKAWKKLAHRAQATAIELSAQEVQDLQRLFRRAGCGNQRVEGYLSHFLFLKDDVERHGPL